MNIKHYTSFFHDGNIFSLKQDSEKIEIWMESSELLSEWNTDNLLLSNANTIKGKLILLEVVNISIDEILAKIIEQEICNLEILRLSIDENIVDFLVESMDYTTRNTICGKIVIKANRIEWKNEPDLCFE